jgi:hypothetical protein
MRILRVRCLMCMPLVIVRSLNSLLGQEDGHWNKYGIPEGCMGRPWRIIFATNRFPISLGFGLIPLSSLQLNTKPMG